jgi:hypothetical protein
VLTHSPLTKDGVPLRQHEISWQVALDKDGWGIMPPLCEPLFSSYQQNTYRWGGCSRLM